MIEKIYMPVVIVLLIILFGCLTIAWRSDTDALTKYEHKIRLIKAGIADQKSVNYKMFINELKSDLNTYDISPSDSLALNKLAKKIVHEELAGQKSMLKKVVNSSFYGILQGGATGFITGGAPGALGGAIVFGVISPIITTYKEVYPTDELLA